MKRFTRLLIMETENVWRFPTLEIMIAIGIINALRQPNPLLPTIEYFRTAQYVANPGWGTSTFFLIFLIPVLVARSFAKGLSGTETRVMLSYPIKRWETLLSKLLIVLLPTLAIFSTVFLLSAFYLFQLPTLNPLPYSLLLSLLLPMLFLTALSFSLSLIAKDELKTVLFSLFIILSLESSLDYVGAPYKYIFIRGSTVISQYLHATFNGRLDNFFQNYTTADVQVAFGFPIITTIILLMIVFLYFQYKLDID